jgi:TetR/AcrR family transcriptional regulator, cholesterol catabolism regulator
LTAVTDPPSRRQEILAIAAAGFAESGFSGCSVREIAEEADILSGSLYHHFESKDKMVIEILTHYWHSLFGEYDRVLAIAAPPDETLAELVVASLAVANICPNEVRILQQDWHYLAAILPDLDHNMNRIETTFTDVLQAGINQGTLRNDIDPRIAYRTIMGAIAWVTRWYRPNGSHTMNEIGTVQATLLVDGLRTQSGRT